MKKTIVCLLAILAAGILANDALAQLRASQDPFESRRRDAEYRQKLREQQARANQRTVPTFTIPQPALNNGYNNGFNHGFNNGSYDPRFDPRYDRRYFDRNYVFIPGHYQNVYGQLIYVPPHYEYVPR
jgi:hypothetical protein